jgi:tetratricopeptide (TPR) repeat protein
MKTFAKKLFRKAEINFNKENYKKALYYYSTILKENPNNRKAKILAILTEMVMNKEEGASGLYDYYLILQKEGRAINPEDVIENIIDILDSQSFELNKIIANSIAESNNKLLYENGISYSEFKEFVVLKKGFKQAFEDTILSTKVIITNQDDLIDFIQNLFKHGLKTVAINYLESALQTFPDDKRLQFILKEIIN